MKENNIDSKRVFARKVATKLTAKEMQQTQGGGWQLSGPSTPPEERAAENKH